MQAERPSSFKALNHDSIDHQLLVAEARIKTLEETLEKINKENGWRDVKEELPEVSMKLLIVCYKKYDNKMNRAVHVARYYKEPCRSEAMFLKYPNNYPVEVICWKPLPEMPLA